MPLEILDLTTNGVAIADAIKFVRTNKEKLIRSTKDDLNGKESREPDQDVKTRSARRKRRNEKIIYIWSLIRLLPLNLMFDTVSCLDV